MANTPTWMTQGGNALQTGRDMAPGAYGHALPEGAAALMDGETNVVEVISVPDKRVGQIIGSGGSRIQDIKNQSGANVHIEGTGSMLRKVTVWGNRTAVETAVRLIHHTLNSEQPPGSTLSGGGGTPLIPTEDQEIIEVQAVQVGIIIGRSGANIRELQARSATNMWVETTDNLENPCTPGHRRLHISGKLESIELAKALLKALLESRPSGPGGRGGRRRPSLDLT